MITNKAGMLKELREEAEQIYWIARKYKGYETRCCFKRQSREEVSKLLKLKEVIDERIIKLLGCEQNRADQPRQFS